jgi:predicted nucleic acid-binding protein
MIDKIFLDSNLWIYLYAKNPPEKFQQVVEIIKNNSSSLLVSTQVLGELFNTDTCIYWIKNINCIRDKIQQIGWEQ